MLFVVSRKTKILGDFNTHFVRLRASITCMSYVLRMNVLMIVLLAGLAAESSANLFCKSVEPLKDFKFEEVTYGSTIY